MNVEYCQMADRPSDDENAARLERINQLWVELRRADRNSPQHEELVARIREEADAFKHAVNEPLRDS